MVDGAAAVLRAPRALAGGVVFAALLVYYETSEHWWHAGLWSGVAWIACVLMPLVFALVLAALPLNAWPGLLPVGLAFVALAVVLTAAHVNVFANFARLGATTLLGWWFLGMFEEIGRAHV